jgi:Na+:H+ antiporter, NhaA family
MKSGKSAALLLMGVAIMGLVLANSPIGPWLIGVKDSYVGFEAIGLKLTVSHWASDLLLAVFFFVAGLELKYEIVRGVLSKLSTALVPVLAAIGGVVIPALIYVSMTAGTPEVIGWPIPTATDIAFALGILAIFGTGMPKAARVFLLALAIFDDLVAILIIAIFFTDTVHAIWLAIGAAIALFHVFAERKLKTIIVPIRFISFALLWFAVYQSGVHATIAGVVLGLLVPANKAHKLVDKVQPWTNTIALPVFAFFAVAISLPSFAGQFSPVFGAIAIALPVGKILGITALAILANKLAKPESRLGLAWQDYLALSALAGIGFTVSLLMANLAFESDKFLLAEATMAVLVGSLMSMGIGAAIVQKRANYYKKLAKKH